MREILFRGKSVDDNEWVYGSFCRDAVEQLRGVDAGANAFIRFYDTETKKMKMVEVQRETVGQYTGLTDRNGEKIFEGDICKYGYDDEYIGEWFYDVFDFSITGNDDENVFHLLVFDKKKEKWFFQGVIVGNVHDNPKLLEQLQEKKKMIYFFHKGDRIFLLGKYTPDGVIRIIEALVDKTWENGKVRAYTKGSKSEEWRFQQDSFRQYVFYTREEAEEALRQLNNRVVLMPERMPLSVFVIPKL